MWRSFWVQRQGEGWPVAVVVLVGGDGVRFRERTRGEEGKNRGRVRESRGRAWRRPGHPDEEGRAGRQPSRWRGAVARARAGNTPLPLSRTKTTEEGGGLGRLLAGLHRGEPQVSFSSLFLFSKFSDICFDLIKILNHLLPYANFCRS